MGIEVKIDEQRHNLIYKEEVYWVVGACMEVHNTLGSGFLEPVYQQSLQHELGLQQIPFTAQTPINISYKDLVLEKFYVAPFCGVRQDHTGDQSIVHYRLNPHGPGFELPQGNRLPVRLTGEFRSKKP